MTREELDGIIERYARAEKAMHGGSSDAMQLARLLRAALAVVDAERDDHTRDPEPECPACGALVAFDAALSGESA